MIKWRSASFVAILACLICCAYGAATQGRAAGEMFVIILVLLCLISFAFDKMNDHYMSTRESLDKMIEKMFSLDTEVTFTIKVSAIYRAKTRGIIVYKLPGNYFIIRGKGGEFHRRHVSALTPVK